MVLTWEEPIQELLGLHVFVPQSLFMSTVSDVAK